MSSNELLLPDQGTLERARDAVRNGLVLGLSTDTVWGVAVDPFNAEALGRLYERKGRPAEKAVQVLCATEQHARTLMIIPPSFEREWGRLTILWPGAFTAVVPATEVVPRDLTRNGRVGLRVPSSAYTRAVLEACGGILAASSLNLAGDPPASSFEEARASGVADVLLPGPPAGRLASTVYDVLDRRVIREGVVPAGVLEELTCGR